MRNDIIKRTIVTVSGIAIMSYLFWLFSMNIVIVQSEFEHYNMVAYAVLSILALYYTVMYGIYPISIKRHKRTFIVVGLACILMSYTYLVDSPQEYIYIGDFVKVLGVLLVVFGGSGYLVSDKVKKAKAESELEIIEA